MALSDKEPALTHFGSQLPPPQFTACRFRPYTFGDKCIDPEIQSDLEVQGGKRTRTRPEACGGPGSGGWRSWKWATIRCMRGQCCSATDRKWEGWFSRRHPASKLLYMSHLRIVRRHQAPGVASKGKQCPPDGTGCRRHTDRWRSTERRAHHDSGPRYGHHQSHAFLVGHMVF